MRSLNCPSGRGLAAICSAERVQAPRSGAIKLASGDCGPVGPPVTQRWPSAISKGVEEETSRIWRRLAAPRRRTTYPAQTLCAACPAPHPSTLPDGRGFARRLLSPLQTSLGNQDRRPSVAIEAGSHEIWPTSPASTASHQTGNRPLSGTRCNLKTTA